MQIHPGQINENPTVKQNHKFATGKMSPTPTKFSTMYVEVISAKIWVAHSYFYTYFIVTGMESQIQLPFIGDGAVQTL